MKKILYYTARDMTNPSLGINKKIVNQIAVLRKNFYVDAVYRKNDCELVLQKNNGEEVVLKSDMRRPYKVAASKGLGAYLNTHIYDGCYIRYVFADRQFYRLLQKLEKSETNMVVEIPTYPYDSEMLDSLENRIVLFLDRMYRNRMKRYVNCIATYSRDKQIYGIPCIQVTNGIDFEKIPRIVHETGEDVLSMIAVADLAKWHGYDRLLEGMGQYYQQGGERELHFYMVGSGKELELYKEIVKKYDLEKKVTFCGSRYGEELDLLYNKSMLAVECLGAHRKGLKLSSSLKSREYAAKGLPMITAVDIDVFCDGKYPYIYKFSEDEQPINIETVIQFYDSIYKDRDCNQIAEEIRTYAQKLCDMEVAMKPVIDVLKNDKK